MEAGAASSLLSYPLLMSLFATKPLDVILADAEHESLKRSLTAGQLVALGIGAIYGAGLFLSPASPRRRTRGRQWS